MSDLKQTIKTFTPKEYKALSITEIDTLIDRNIAFAVSNLYILDHGFKFCLATQTLYFEEDIVELTKIETKLLAFIVSKDKEIVSVEDIKKVVWDGRDMSVFTLRNVIKHIRDKTYYEIIKNTSNCGYSIWKK